MWLDYVSMLFSLCSVNSNTLWTFSSHWTTTSRNASTTRSTWKTQIKVNWICIIIISRLSVLSQTIAQFSSFSFFLYLFLHHHVVIHGIKLLKFFLEWTSERRNLMREHMFDLARMLRYWAIYWINNRKFGNEIHLHSTMICSSKKSYYVFIMEMLNQNDQSITENLKKIFFSSSFDFSFVEWSGEMREVYVANLDSSINHNTPNKINGYLVHELIFIVTGTLLSMWTSVSEVEESFCMESREIEKFTNFSLNKRAIQISSIGNDEWICQRHKDMEN